MVTLLSGQLRGTILYLVTLAVQQGEVRSLFILPDRRDLRAEHPFIIMYNDNVTIASTSTRMRIA